MIPLHVALQRSDQDVHCYLQAIVKDAPGFLTGKKHQVLIWMLLFVLQGSTQGQFCCASFNYAFICLWFEGHTYLTSRLIQRGILLVYLHYSDVNADMVVVMWILEAFNHKSHFRSIKRFIKGTLTFICKVKVYEHGQICLQNKFALHSQACLLETILAISHLDIKWPKSGRLKDLCSNQNKSDSNEEFFLVIWTFIAYHHHLFIGIIT